VDNISSLGYPVPVNRIVEEIAMAKGARENIKLKSTESSECYWTTKNKRTSTERLELKKYDKKLKRRVLFKEAK
jgi:large subunit ribosomal protein L33